MKFDKICYILMILIMFDIFIIYVICPYIITPLYGHNTILIATIIFYILIIILITYICYYSIKNSMEEKRNEEHTIELNEVKETKEIIDDYDNVYFIVDDDQVPLVNQKLQLKKELIR